MTNFVELPRESFIHISSTVSVAEALNVLNASNYSYAVIGDAQHPQTLFSKAQLDKFEKTYMLGELPELPILLLVDGSQWTIEQVKKISQLFKQNKACCGLVIYQQARVTGVISRVSVAKALPLNSGERIYGDPQVSVRTYICRQCAPPTYAFPRQGDTPTCPKDWLHGSMEQEFA